MADPSDATGTRRRVVYTITPGPQAHIGTFDIKITGFDPNFVIPSLKLKPGAPFTREVLGDDLVRIKQVLIAKGFMAPQLEDPVVQFDPERNAIDIYCT